MPRGIEIAPFVQLPEDPPGELLFVSPWEFESDSSGGDHEHWDYKVDITCKCTIAIEDQAKLREHCGLSEETVLSMFGEWSTDLTNYVRGRGQEVHVTLDGDSRIEKEISVPVQGAYAGGELTLEQFLTVEEPSGSSPAGPSVPGSILWRSATEVPLESPGSRLPITVVDFENFPHRFGDEKAAWEVEIEANAFELPPSRSMRIYINSKHEQLVEAVTNDESGYDSNLTSQMLYYDVGRHLLSRALRDELFCDPEYEYEEGSLGASMRMRLESLFPNSSLSEIRNLYEEDPRAFESTLQGNFLELP